ncbi:MAG TPA: Spy/CpxP family protein refolding chaperone [Burkholderiales bacterium]|nr:Spy/CpxP family protein refolding chaperone [Burkholderiales bacterium]
MNKTFTLRASVLAMGLLAASGFAAAADEAPAAPPAGQHAQHRHFDPVARTQHNLDALEKKLGLKDDQKAAWQSYSESVLARVKDGKAKMEDMHARRGQAREEADTATKLERMSQAMREHADTLQKAAQDTRTFESALSPEQKTIFDLYWKSQFRHRMGHHPAA